MKNKYYPFPTRAAMMAHAFECAACWEESLIDAGVIEENDKEAVAEIRASIKLFRKMRRKYMPEYETLNECLDKGIEDGTIKLVNMADLKENSKFGVGDEN